MFKRKKTVVSLIQKSMVFFLLLILMSKSVHADYTEKSVVVSAEEPVLGSANAGGRLSIGTIHQLKEPGFSTKGDGRGIGLSNLEEMVNECDNVYLETLAKDGVFLQKIIIA